MQAVESPPRAIAAPPAEPAGPRWASVIAQELATRGVRPRAITLASGVFALLAAAFLPVGTFMRSWVGTAALILAAVCIQLRLACNLLEPIVAARRNLKTRSREVFNDLLDRGADAVILVAAGYAIYISAIGPFVGWTAAVLAIMISYLEVLQSYGKVTQESEGLLGKKHRMVAMTVTCAVAALVPPGFRQMVVFLGLALLTVGCAIVTWLRFPRSIRI